MSYRYHFDGVDQYATHAAWNTLGDSTVYAPEFSFNTDNPDGFIVDPTLPITEFGRVGTDYHDGYISNLQYIDTSPLNGVTAINQKMDVPDVLLRNAEITFDMSYATGAQTLLGGTPAILTSDGSDNLVGGTYVDSINVDGSAYTTGAVSGHMRIVVQVSFGYFNQLGDSTSVYGGTLTIRNDAY